MNVPPTTETSLPKVIQAIADLARGASNALSPMSFALAVGATETIVTNRECTESHVPMLAPFSAAAAGSGWYVKAVGPGSFTVGHASAPAGAVFRYELRRN